jgi:hypothetical protein
VKLEMPGAPDDGNTMKSALLVTLSPPQVTVILPVVAPLGTLTVNAVGVAAVTVAAVPLNATVFSDGVALKPNP